MKRSEDRILTTHVGSIVRPKELRDRAASFKTRPDEKVSFEDFLRQQVADVVKTQARIGIDIVNDGEFGKSSWAAYVMERLSGFEIRTDKMLPIVWLGRDRDRFLEAIATEVPRALTGAPMQACIGPITYQDMATIKRDVANFSAALKAARVEEGFFTTVAPASTATAGVNEYYPNEHDYVFAIAEALRQEYLAIYNAGLIVQVDDALLANVYDHLVQQSPQHFRQWAELRIDALNHALRGIPEDRIRYHLCFGSWHVPHMSDAPLEALIDLILRVRAGAYSIEAANVRHEHEWRVWETAKLNGKILIPGVVTHHTITVEHPRLVADRIIRFAKLVGRENVIAGTDCGFAQTEATQRVHPAIMWAKLEALVEGARIATKELWGR